MSAVLSIVRHTSDIVLAWFRKEGTTRGDAESARQRAEAALHEAEARLLQADRQHEEFLAVLAHELRNLLTPISTAAQLLKYTDQDPARIRTTSDIIGRQVSHITKLFDDLLDVSHMQDGRLQLDLSPQDIKTVLSEAIEQVRSMLAERHQQLELELDDDDIVVTGEYARLVQVFVTLLSNAARHAPPGGQIVLSAHAARQSAEMCVRYNSAGITPDAVPHGFDPFTQIEPAKAQRGGSGLGLMLAEKLVQLHGGTVTSYSKGPGSCFAVLLPRIEPGGNDRQANSG